MWVCQFSKILFFFNIDSIDETVYNNCLEDDLYYTYLALKNGYLYNTTKNLYFTNMPTYNSINGYSTTNNTFQFRNKTIDFLKSYFKLLK